MVVSSGAVEIAVADTQVMIEFIKGNYPTNT
jgi:hypothetical protein